MCVFKLKESILKSIGIVLLLTAIASCSSEDDGIDPVGGISGTGVLLNGTVQNNRAFASNTVQIKSAGNPVVTTSIDPQGVFSISELPDSAPYLLRVDFTSGAPFYALTYKRDGQQNIHGYSDLAIRNWYASQGLDVNDAFAGSIDVVPTQEQILVQTDVINSLLGTVLAEYGLSDINLFTAEYLANDQGVDGFLDNNPVIIINGGVNIIVTNPSTNLQSPLATNLPLTTDLSVVDVNPPSQPSSLRALPSADSEIILAWNASTDDIGVSRYDVMRDGVAIATSTFPAFIDSTVEDGISYSYTVVAIDASGNQSVESAAAVAEVSVDVTPPPTPSNVNLEPTTDSIRISWDQQLISDVSSFEVIADSDSLFNTTSTFAYQADLLSDVEYCYQIIAIDGSGNQSSPTEITCTVTLQPGVQAPIVTPDVEPIPNDPLIVGVPSEATILGEWGGLISIGSGDFPLLIEVEADGNNGYDGNFSYPTRTLCRGSLDFVAKINGVYEFIQNNTFTGGSCPENARVTVSASMFGSEEVLEIQHYDPDTNLVDYSGFLRSRSVSPEDLLDDSWGAIVTGPIGETPLLFNIESGTGGTMSGDFDYPTRSLCRGSIIFIAKINEIYEFYQSGTFSGGDCPGNARVTVSKSIIGSEQVLEFQSFDSETDLVQYSGTLQLNFVSPDDPIVGNWGGLVTESSGEISFIFSVEVDRSGKLSGNFNFPTLTLCRGSLNFVAKIDEIYELYQVGTFSGGDCPGSARVRVSLPADELGQVLDYSLIDPETNQVGTVGRLSRQ